jgi:hypothetical protein
MCQFIDRFHLADTQNIVCCSISKGSVSAEFDILTVHARVHVRTVYKYIHVYYVIRIMSHRDRLIP